MTVKKPVKDYEDATISFKLVNKFGDGSTGFRDKRNHKLIKRLNVSLETTIVKFYRFVFVNKCIYMILCLSNCQ